MANEVPSYRLLLAFREETRGLDNLDDIARFGGEAIARVVGERSCVCLRGVHGPHGGVPTPGCIGCAGFRGTKLSDCTLAVSAQHRLFEVWGHDELVGVVAVERNGWEQDRLEMVEALAATIGSAVDGVLRRRDANVSSGDRRAVEVGNSPGRVAKLLSEAIEVVASWVAAPDLTSEVDVRLQTLLRMTAAAVGASAGYLALNDPEGSEPEGSLREMGRIVFLDGSHMGRMLEFGSLRRLSAWAFRSGCPVFENHFAESEWRSLLPHGHLRVDNVMLVPVMMRGHRLGAILCLANKAEHFDGTDAVVAADFGRLISVLLTLRASAASGLRS